jgi:DHA1 family bicyclomycin/chloramphenicol resistance-like MFS transporter
MNPASRGFIVFLAMLVAIGPLSTDLYLPSLPTLVRVFGVPVSEIQLTLSVFLVGFAVSQLFYGPMSDRFGRRPVLLAGLVLFAAASLACAFAPSVPVLIGLRLVQAIGACSARVVGFAIVRDLFDRDRGARMLAYSGAIMGIAPAVAPVIGGYVLVWFGWQANFVLLTVWALALAGLVALRLPETLRQPDPYALAPLRLLANTGALLAHPRFTGAALTNSAVFSGLIAFISGSSFVLIDVFGIAAEKFGLFFALGVAGYMSGTFASGRLAGRISGDRLVLVAAVGAAASGLAMAALAVSPFAGPWAVMVPMTGYMVAFGVIMPQSTAAAMAPFPATAVLASALLGFLQMTIAAGVGVVVGVLHDGTSVPLAVTVAVAGCLTLIVHVAARHFADGSGR